MRKKIIILLVLAITGQASWAIHTAVLGGVRGGAAFGLQLEENLTRNLKYRLGLEATTGNNPLIFFGGGKIGLTEIDRMPLSLSLGLVAYAGQNSSLGAAVALVLDRVFSVDPLFIEVGSDVGGEARLVAQIGYRILTPRTESLH
ncbi:MAG: hypothetical protein WCW67_04510 [Candidatus Margulisiibacteriota bacterium]|jgi:hypothetical protein